jgi:hypothetical protein
MRLLTVVALAVVHLTIAAPTRTPRANAKWPVVIHVTGAHGKPLRATLTMRILFAGQPVGKVDNGKVWRFVGTWHEPKGQEITWPPSSRGQPLAFQAIVHAAGRTVKKSIPIRVR